MSYVNEIEPDLALVDCLKKMDEIGKKLLVITENGKFINVLSIGDIQRAIINNVDLQSRADGITREIITVASSDDSIEEIKHTAKRSSEKAIQSVDIADKTMVIAKKGTESLLKNMGGLNQIKEKMDLIASNIIQLSEQSKIISEIITTVEDIANQSNLLAVNASIEAVKAGEHGKGFSVVSQELKNLAEQSKQGTKQVQKIIFDIQKVTGTLVMAAEQGGKAVESGVKEAEDAKEAMDQLNTVINNMANKGKQIAASYEQELSGMDQITDAMSNIQEMTAQNVNSIKQLEVSAKDLNSMSQKLKEMLGRYSITKSS